MGKSAKKTVDGSCCVQLERVGLRVSALETFKSEMSHLLFGKNGAEGMRIDVNSMKEWRDRTEKEKAVEAAYRRRLAILLFGLLGGTFMSSFASFLWLFLEILPVLKSLSE